MTDPRNTVAAAIDELVQENAQLRAQAAEERAGREKAEKALTSLTANLAKAGDLITLKVFECDIDATSRPRPLRMANGYVLRSAIVGWSDAMSTLNLDTFPGEYETAIKLYLVGGSSVFVDLGEEQSVNSFLATLVGKSDERTPKEKK